MEAHLIQNTQAWLEWRKDKIGASSLSIIMGLNPWKSPYTLWSEMLGLRDPEPVNERMQRGTDLEPVAREYYFNLTGIEMSPKVVVHPAYPYFFSSLDGINSTGTQILEIKCGGKKLHEDAKNGIVPIYYNIQMQWQMYITGLEDCHYLSFDGNEGVLIVVKRDQELINQMVSAAEIFREFLRTITPPAYTELDYDDKTEDPVWTNMMSYYSHYDDMEKKGKAGKERTKLLLVEYANGRNVKGSNSKFTKVTTVGRVDYTKIPEIQGLDLEPYRGKPVESYRITINNT